ncbi:hypothetical protein L1887_59554 [Cichorium endivia]|nr:hypothetical protein L1887_59554 [Cichorium endivia]
MRVGCFDSTSWFEICARKWSRPIEPSQCLQQRQRRGRASESESESEGKIGFDSHWNRIVVPANRRVDGCMDLESRPLWLLSLLVPLALDFWIGKGGPHVAVHEVHPSSALHNSIRITASAAAAAAAAASVFLIRRKSGFRTGLLRLMQHVLQREKLALRAQLPPPPPTRVQEPWLHGGMNAMQPRDTRIARQPCPASSVHCGAASTHTVFGGTEVEPECSHRMATAGTRPTPPNTLGSARRARPKRKLKKNPNPIPFPVKKRPSPTALVSAVLHRKRAVTLPTPACRNAFFDFDFLWDRHRSNSCAVCKTVGS